MDTRRMLTAAVAGALGLATSNALPESLTDTLRNALGSLAEPILDIATSTANTNVVAPASANGLTFEFDVETGLPKRVLTPLGPIFTERADTIGRGKVALNVTYIRLEYDEIDGHDLSNGELILPVDTPLGVQSAQIIADSYSENLFLSATYGVRDNLDLGIHVPFTRNSLDLQVVTPLGSTRAANDASGLNDISIYGKYRFLILAPVTLAASLKVSAPTGDADNFLGLGSWRVQPLLIASTRGRKINAHLDVGFDLGDTSELNHEFRYRAGVDWAITAPLTVTGELLGRYILGDYDRTTITGTGQASRFVADGVIGVKLNFWKDALLFAGALIALNDTGLRAKVAPTVGLEASF